MRYCVIIMIFILSCGGHKTEISNIKEELTKLKKALSSIPTDGSISSGVSLEYLDSQLDGIQSQIQSVSNEVKSMLLNEEGTKGIVYVTQPYMNLNAAAVLRDEIDAMLTEDTGLEGTESSKLTGGLPVSLDINEGIHSSQNLTTIVTMIILTIVLAIVFRSPRLGIITMVPVAVVILWQPLLMNSPDVNVNIFTAMVGTIVFGIGVDDLSLIHI